jgi:hypothetical protein
MKQIIFVLVAALLLVACDKRMKRTIEIVAQDQEGRPVTHARVYLQGIYQGETNENGVFAKDTVILGDVSLGVIVYDPATNVKVPRTVFVHANTPGIIRETVMISKPEVFSSVTIKSDPSGATVFLNDIDVGKTPHTEKVPFGEQHFRVATPDGKRSVDSTLVVDQPTLEINFKLSPPPVPMAMLEIDSDPQDAIVYLDERQAGRTPFSIQVKFGRYHLRVVHDNGAKPEDEWVTVDKEKVFRSYTFPDPIKAVRLNVSREEEDIAREFDLAQSHFAAKRWREAEQGFSAILGKRGYYGSAYFYRALARFQQKRYQEALKDFERTLEFRNQILVGERDKVIHLLEYYRALSYKNLYQNEQNEDRRKLYREEAIYEFENYLRDFGMRPEYKDFVANAEMFLRELKEAEQ